MEIVNSRKGILGLKLCTERARAKPVRRRRFRKGVAGTFRYKNFYIFGFAQIFARWPNWPTLATLGRAICERGPVVSLSCERHSPWAPRGKSPARPRPRAPPRAPVRPRGRHARLTSSSRGAHLSNGRRQFRSFEQVVPILFICSAFSVRRSQTIVTSHNSHRTFAWFEGRWGGRITSREDVLVQVRPRGRPGRE